MSKQPWFALVAVFVVALAGCAGTFAAEAGTPATTPPPTAESADSLPGIEGGTVANASALVGAHEATLIERGFVVVVEQEATANTTKHHRNSTRLVRYKAEPGLARYYVYERERFEATDDREAATVVDETWVNDTVSVRRTELPDRTEYEPYHFERYPGVMTGGASLAGTIEAGGENFTVADVRRVRGRTVFTFEASFRGVARGNSYNHETVRFTVDDRGVIRHLTLTERTVIPNESLGSVDVDRPVEVVRRFEFRLTELGDADATAPVWLDEARARGALEYR